MDYDFKPGMRVVSYGRWDSFPSFAVVEKLSRGFAVVNGQNFRMDGSSPGWKNEPIRPATAEDDARMARHNLEAKVRDLLGRTRPYVVVQNMSDEHLNAIVAVLTTALPAPTQHRSPE